MRRTKDEADQTRQALLEAALKVFSQQGYDGARLEDVAEAAGVTRGAIYHHFGGKAELFRALVDEASAAGSEAVERAIAEGGDFIAIARRVLVYTLELLHTNTRFRRTMALYLFKTGSWPELEDYQAQRRVEMEQEVEQVAGFFRMGLDQGAVRAGVDPHVAARAFLAYQNGLSLMWLLNPSAFPIEKEAEALADVFVLGIAPEKSVPA